MKQPIIHTERLIIRAITLEDAPGMFEMDSNPKVHEYLGKKPASTIEEVYGYIKFIRAQYRDNGIGRWAVEEKDTGNFVGWTGFKFHTKPLNDRIHFLDLGYRFQEAVWGKGYATETSFASMQYAFDNLEHDTIYGMAETVHAASNHILKKMGMKYVNTFHMEGDACHFYSVSREEWKLLNR